MNVNEPIPGSSPQELQSNRGSFDKFINDTNAKAHQLVEGKKGEAKSKYPAWMQDQVRKLVRDAVATNPPYFYSRGGAHPNYAFLSSDMIEDKQLASDVAKLGQTYDASTQVIEWNRTDGHRFILSTFLPDATQITSQVYKQIPYDVAVHLVETEGVPTVLGWHGSDVWYDENTNERHQEPRENFTEPQLEANRAKNYTEPWNTSSSRK